ncbi:MAG TPA: magnesium and cobalt transport protein CorA [Spongiibacteraceae bacterium]|jgi:magnesium transporter
MSDDNSETAAPTMIVNSVAYRDGKRLGEVAIDAISDVVKEPHTFVWVGLHDADPSLLLKMQEEFDLHELAIEDALKAHQRPKLESYGSSLFIVVKTAQMLDERVNYGETHFFVGANFLVSVRHGCTQGYAQVRERCEAAPPMLAKGPAYALYALLDFIVDKYQPVVAHFEREFDTLEGDIFKGQFHSAAIERLYDLKTQLHMLRNAVTPIEDITLQLTRVHADMIPKEMNPYFRDVHDHVARVIATLDNLREMLTTAMQVNLALVTVAQNEVVKRLAGWGAVLAIPTVIFSLYGMNFRVMPELNWRFGYPLVVGGTAIGCSLLYRKLKRSGWL